MVRAETEAISEGVEARSWILRERGGRVLRGVGGKGGFRRPSLGVRSFWVGEGMERWEAMRVLRSRMVAVGGKVRGWGVPRWVIVMVMSESEGAGSEGAGAGGGEAIVCVVLRKRRCRVMLLWRRP